jgi:hypothetical protein
MDGSAAAIVDEEVLIDGMTVHLNTSTYTSINEALRRLGTSI